MPVWARRTEIRNLTGVPLRWLATFAKEHPDCVRKLGKRGSNATLLYHTAAVLAAVEAMGGAE